MCDGWSRCQHDWIRRCWSLVDSSLLRGCFQRGWACRTVSSEWSLHVLGIFLCAGGSDRKPEGHVRMPACPFLSLCVRVCVCMCVAASASAAIWLQSLWTFNTDLTVVVLQAFSARSGLLELLFSWIGSHLALFFFEQHVDCNFWVTSALPCKPIHSVLCYEIFLQSIVPFLHRNLTSKSADRISHHQAPPFKASYNSFDTTCWELSLHMVFLGDTHFPHCNRRGEDVYLVM